MVLFILKDVEIRLLLAIENMENVQATSNLENFAYFHRQILRQLDFAHDL